MRDKNFVLLAGGTLESAGMLQKILRTAGMDGEIADTEDRLAEMLQGDSWDLLLLDAGDTGKSLFNQVRRIREKKPGVPVVVLCDPMEEFDTVYGYEVGVDDFIVKPFSPVLLGAKLKAVIRLSHCGERQSNRLIEAGPFRYNCSTLQMYKNGKELQLTAKENAIMKLFLDNEGRFFTRETLYRMIWGAEASNDNAVMVYINRIRAKIEEDPSNPVFLQTVRGFGYRFTAS